jgi:predicted dithiol-disulfide oxidoreductase (DUF899 family)
MTTHPTGTRQDWLAARVALLQAEKELTRRSDEVARQRQALPWVRVDKDYRFDTDGGSASLADLFQGRSQLIVYHFMFAPEWKVGCKSCSFWADNFERNVVHLAERDATMVAISRAPIEKLLAFRQRLGWTFKWVSSGRSDFNYDYRVSFKPDEADQIYNFARKTDDETDQPGISVFHRDGQGSLFRTYSTYGRGIEPMNAAFHYLDLLPKGRDEGDRPMGWLRRRDEYDDAPA